MKNTPKCGTDVWRSTFEIGTAELGSVAEIAPKSPFLMYVRTEALSDDFPGASNEKILEKT